MAESPAGPTVLYRSVRQLGAGLFSALQERFELLAIEIQEEKLRLIQTLILINAAIVLGFLALIFITLAIVFAFHDSARMVALWCVSAFYLLLCGGMVVALRRTWRRQAEVLPETRRVLETDRSCIPPST